MLINSDLKVSELLSNYKKTINGFSKLKFSGVDNKDVYNITAPFFQNSDLYIAGRVESRHSEIDSKTMFFRNEGSSWILDENMPVFNLQDPFLTKIDNLIIFGGVKVYSDTEDKSVLTYKTVFYKGEDIRKLEKFFEGPERMKDIRLIQLSDKRIGVFTRPQGKIGGRGKIGFAIINSLEDLSQEIILNAELIDGLFTEEEWGGVNEAHIIDKDNLGILGHIAYFSEDNSKHYYSMSFIYNLSEKKALFLKIIARRDDLSIGESKREDLKDILFSGGLIRNEDGSAKLYVGAGDAEAYEILTSGIFS